MVVVYISSLNLGVQNKVICKWANTEIIILWQGIYLAEFMFKMGKP